MNFQPTLLDRISPFGPAHERKNTFVKLTCGVLKGPLTLPEEDALTLLKGCLDPLHLDDPKRFPPSLFVLWVTKRFIPRLPALLTALDRERKYTEIPFDRKESEPVNERRLRILQG